MLEDPSALSPGAVLAGKFRVVRCLGMGGMGSVYEIEHELTKHRRALKLLHASMAAVPGVVERFLREASAAGRVGNPHIVETFDAGTLDTGEPYLVMEILRGETLTDRIERGQMPLADMVDLIGQACEGIQAAHDAGIVHRDLKPDNLFVLDVEGRPFVKILDFGISKFDPGKTGGLALTQEGAALGTPYYMSPEQIRGEINLDARADVYAMGVILYECAAARRPFEADALTQLAVLIHMGKPQPLSEIRPDLPPAFCDLVMRSMAADREQRLQSMSGLRAELEKYGTISFRGTAGPGTAMSALGRSPERSVAAPALATSAAGVSVRAASAVAQKKKSQSGPIVAGFAILAVMAGVGLFALRGGGSAAVGPEAASSAGPAGAAGVSPSPAVTPAPAVTDTPAAAAPSPSPAASIAAAPPASSAQPAPAAKGFPVVVPTLAQPPAPKPTPATAANPGTNNGTPAAPPPRARRTDERGLAKDNPFR